jgi:hypothetical protein
LHIEGSNTLAYHTDTCVTTLDLTLARHAATHEAEPCQSNADCGAKQVCTHPGGLCGKDGEPGKCLDRPHVCPAGGAPACGCDGRVYVDGCVALSRGVETWGDRGCDLTKWTHYGAPPAKGCNCNGDLLCMARCPKYDPPRDAGAPVKKR